MAITNVKYMSEIDIGFSEAPNSPKLVEKLLRKINLKLKIEIGNANFKFIFKVISPSILKILYFLKHSFSISDGWQFMPHGTSFLPRSSVVREPA